MAKIKFGDVVKGLMKSQESTSAKFEGADSSFKDDPDQHFVIKNQFERHEDRWIPIKFDDLLDLKLGYFFEEKRIMLQCRYKNDEIYIVSDDRDAAAIKIKKPKSVVINIVQLFRFWTGHISLNNDNDPIFKVMPDIITVQKVFPGAEVVSYNDIDI